MTSAVEEHLVEDWLRRLKWALERMPSPEREDIVAETRAHLEERTAKGHAPEMVLASFGEPEAYAAGFMEDMELSRVLARPRMGELLTTIGRHAHKSLVAAVAFILVLMIAGVAMGMVSTAVWKLSDPAHAGLWIGPGTFFFGIMDEPGRKRELLGNGIYPVAVLGVGLAWMLCRLLLIWAVRTIKRRA